MVLSYNRHHVKFHDIDGKRVLTLKNQGYDATEDIDEVINHSDVVFVCVPTPTVGDRIELNTILNAQKYRRCYPENRQILSHNFSKHNSTSSRPKLLPLLEEGSGLKSGDDFWRLHESGISTGKKPLDDFLSPNRIIVGALDRRSGTFT